MELDRFAEIVEDMILQHDYPGFEPRSLRLGLPSEVLRMHTKTFASALGHANVYVKLAALRWFQERPGMAKSYINAIIGLLDNADEFVRMESVKTIEKVHDLSPDSIVKMTTLLKDQEVEVRKAAAKALGKLGSRSKQKDPAVLDALREAARDSNPEVRMKAQKAVRLIEQ
jgi:vesicle coat complex subunit